MLSPTSSVVYVQGAAMAARNPARPIRHYDRFAQPVNLMLGKRRPTSATNNRIDSVALLQGNLLMAQKAEGSEQRELIMKANEVLGSPERKHRTVIEKRDSVKQVVFNKAPVGPADLHQATRCRLEPGLSERDCYERRNTILETGAKATAPPRPLKRSSSAPPMRSPRRYESKALKTNTSYLFGSSSIRPPPVSARVPPPTMLSSLLREPTELERRRDRINYYDIERITRRPLQSITLSHFKLSDELPTAEEMRAMAPKRRPLSPYAHHTFEEIIGEVPGPLQLKRGRKRAASVEPTTNRVIQPDRAHDPLRGHGVHHSSSSHNTNLGFDCVPRPVPQGRCGKRTAIEAFVPIQLPRRASSAVNYNRRSQMWDIVGGGQIVNRYSEFFDSN